MAMFKINGYSCCPSAYTWGLMDNSASDAGRVQDKNDTMYKNRTSQKRKLQLSFNGVRPEIVSEVLKAINDEYFYVTYPDAMSNSNETRMFYCGDRTAPVKQWFVGGHLYEQLSFNLIER